MLTCMTCFPNADKQRCIALARGGHPHRQTWCLCASMRQQLAIIQVYINPSCLQSRVCTRFSLTYFAAAMHSLQFLGCALLLALTPVYAVSGPAIATHFRRVLSPKTGVYLPSHPNYASETTQRWNAFGAPSYVVSVKPALDTDVQKIVRCAVRAKAFLHLQCVGHERSLASTADACSD